ncbi:MAG: hypothetical protein EXS42_00560 [Lacunisphaera sp.]|nr:hypothetical protein [Lacunisphaera sp.]
MDLPAPARLTAFPLPRTLSAVFLAVLVIGYAWFLRLHTSPYAGGADSSGYLNSAALLRAGQLSTAARTLAGHTAGDFGPLAHHPLGFTTRAGTNLMAPCYPIGLPLHLAAFSCLVGLDWAAIPLNICNALVGGALLYLLARRLDLPRSLALAGTVGLLLCPLYLFAALQPMSDLLALVWSLAALYAALRAREGLGWALGCGVAVAWAVLVRPTNLLLVVPVVLALGTSWRSHLWVGLGGLPGALLLASYNRQLYGSPFVTGYGEVWSAFSSEFLAHNLAHFARWIPLLLSPVIVLALAAPFLPSARRRDNLILAVWFFALTGLYLFYYHSGETWWYLRFILPAFPMLILAALLVLQALWSRPRPAWLHAAFIGLLLVLTSWWQVRQIRQLDLLGMESGERTYPEAARWAQQNLPANSAVFSMQVSGAFYYYTDFLLLRWDQFQFEKREALLAALAAENRPAYAALFPFETPEALERIGGQWTKLATVGQVTFWRRQP